MNICKINSIYKNRHRPKNNLAFFGIYVLNFSKFNLDSKSSNNISAVEFDASPYAARPT